MAFQLARVERLQKLEAAEKFPRDRHHGTPVVEFTAILHVVSTVPKVVSKDVD